MRRGMFHGGAKIKEPNTFIGGVGATLSSTALYFANTNLPSVSDINNFQVDGSNNVSFNVALNHRLTSNNIDNSALSYWIDSESKITYMNGPFLISSANLKYLYLNGVNSAVGAGSTAQLSSLTNLLHINLENIPACHIRWFLRNATNLKKADLRNATTLNYAYNRETMVGMTSLERLYLGKLTTTNQLVNDIAVTQNPVNPCFFNNKIGFKLYVHSSQGITDRKSWAKMQLGDPQIGDEWTLNGLTYKGVNGSPATDGEYDCSVGVSQTARLINIRNAINSDTRTGTIGKISANQVNVNFLALYQNFNGIGGNATTSSIVFLNTGSTVNIDSFSGGFDYPPFLMYARDVRSANIIVVSAPITVNPPASLSYSGLTATSVVLSFTTPIANANGTDAYEVWIDDGTVYRKMFEHSEITASGGSVDITGVARPFKVKIRTIDGQMNYSEFSNEITIV